MSGPITRQYGVPNWDEIFGKKDGQAANPPAASRPDEKTQAAEETPPPADAGDSSDR